MRRASARHFKLFKNSTQILSLDPRINHRNKIEGTPAVLKLDEHTMPKSKNIMGLGRVSGH